MYGTQTIITTLANQVTHILKEQGKDMNNYKFQDMFDHKTVLVEHRRRSEGSVCAAHISYNEGSDDYTVKLFKSEPFPVCVSNELFEGVTVDQLSNLINF